MGETLTCCTGNESIQNDIQTQQETKIYPQNDQQCKPERILKKKQDRQCGKQLKKVNLDCQDIRIHSDADMIDSFRKNWQSADKSTQSRKLVSLKFKESKTLYEAFNTMKQKEKKED